MQNSLYDPSSQLGRMESSSQANAPRLSITGNETVDNYLNSIEDPTERQKALEELTAPSTGEEIHQDMLRAQQEGRIYDPNKADWEKLQQYNKTKESDIGDALQKGAEHIVHAFSQGLGSLNNAENIQKVPLSVAEAFVQNGRTMYGILAKSEDNTSWQSQFFNAINGRPENSDAAYQEFLKARQFNRDSEDLISGKTSILIDKRHLNNDFVQAAAFVADPMMFVPFAKAAGIGAHALGMGERMMAIGARTEAIKNMIIGGTIKYGVGAPLEFVGNAARNTIEYGTKKFGQGFEATLGVSEAEARQGIRMAGLTSVGAGAFGHSIPVLTSAGQIGLYGTTAANVGETVSMIGHQVLKGERGLASYAKMALEDARKSGVPLSSGSKSLLKVLNAFDPLADYGTTIAGGAAHGAMIGAALGGWGGGVEGAAGGVGAGLVLGAGGATLGRGIADVTGATRAARTHLTANFNLEALREIHPEQAKQWDNARIFAEAHGFTFDGILAAKEFLHPDTAIHILKGKTYDSYLESVGLDPKNHDGLQFTNDGDMPLTKKQFIQQNGYIIENQNNGSVKIYINADTAPRATLGHEIFHSVLKTSVMKDFYVSELKDRILGQRNEKGELTQNSVISEQDAKAMFRRYLKAEHGSDPAAYKDALVRLDSAEKLYFSKGELVGDPALNGRSLLEHLSEEFGAYYFSHMVMDKPIDWLYYGGDLPGIRGIIEDAKLNFSNYWRGRMGASHPEFNFNRTFVDPRDGRTKNVPIDEAFAPYQSSMDLNPFSDTFGQTVKVNTKRVVNPAMDMFMRDMLRIERGIHETGELDLNNIPESVKKKFVEDGVDGMFTKRNDGTWETNSAAKIREENRMKGKSMYKTLTNMKEGRTFSIDGEGSIRGFLSPEALDAVVTSGAMSRAMANKIQLMQQIVTNKTNGNNIITFGGIGASAERPEVGSNPSRVFGNKVPYKVRNGVIFGMETTIKKNGEFSFKATMLDHSVLETRKNNIWSDPNIAKLWNNNFAEYTADFYRYLENASKDPTQAAVNGRIPSAELWTDGKGGERRNALHQVLGMAKSDKDTYINSPLADIDRNHMSTVMSFSLNRMTGVRLLSNSKAPFNLGAFKDLVKNWSPSEMNSEETPNGRIYTHPSGFKFIEKDDRRTDAFDEKGKKIGSFGSPQEAVDAGRRYARKNPSTILDAENDANNNAIVNESIRAKQEELLNPTIKYSPNENAGETTRVPREMPRFNDSIIHYPNYTTPSITRTPFDIPEFNPHEFEPIGKNDSPDPKRHSFWQYLDWSERNKDAEGKGKASILDMLTFLKDSGNSMHPDIERDFISSAAETILSILNPIDAGFKPTIKGSGSQFASYPKGILELIQLSKKFENVKRFKKPLGQQLLELKEKLMFDTENLELKTKIKSIEAQLKASALESIELKKKADELAEKLKNEIEDEEQKVNEDTEDEDEGDTDENGNEVKKKKKPPFDPETEIEIREPVQGKLQRFADLKTLIENYHGVLYNKTNFQDNPFFQSEHSRALRALTGHSFEGVALEEMIHGLFARPTHLVKNIEIVPAGEIGLADLTRTGKATGTEWANGVDSLIQRTQEKIAKGEKIPTAILSFVRVLALQRYILKNTMIRSPNGSVESLWTSKGFELNKSMHSPSGKSLKTRGKLKSGYEKINRFEQIEKQLGETTLQSLEIFEHNQESNVYRLASTQEFLIALFNDPQNIAEWSTIPKDPTLDTLKQTALVHKPNLNKAIDNFVKQTESWIGHTDKSNTQSVVSQLAREVITLLEAGNETPFDIKKHEIPNFERPFSEKSLSKLPERPQGYLTPWERQLIEDYRDNYQQYYGTEEGLYSRNISDNPTRTQGVEFKNGVPVKVDKTGALVGTFGEQEGQIPSYYDNSNGLNWSHKVDIPHSDSKNPLLGMSDWDIWQLISKGNLETKNVGIKSSNDRANNSLNITFTPEEKAKHKNWQTAPTELTPKQILKDEVEILDRGGVDIETNTVEIEKRLKQEEAQRLKDEKEAERKRLKEEKEAERQRLRDEREERRGGGGGNRGGGGGGGGGNGGGNRGGGGDRGERNVQPNEEYQGRPSTVADIRIWRTYKTETYGNGRSMKNAIGFTILELGKNFKVYNPYNALIGIYNSEDQARRRVQREEPKK